MLYLLSFILSSSLMASTSSEVELAKKTIIGIISPFLVRDTNKSTKKALAFRVDECEKYKIDWGKMLFSQEKVTLTYHFKTGCDIDGEITPKIITPFPVSLKLQHLGPYTLVESTGEINANLQVQPIINLEMKKGLITGSKGTIHFVADYHLQLNPLAEGKEKTKNLGGTLLISEIHGKKVHIKEKFFIK